MRVAYRRRGRNVLCAITTASVVVFTLLVLLAPTIPSAYRWAVPGVAIGGSVVVARYLRRAVVVDEVGITCRSGWSTEFVAWSSIKRLRFDGETGGHVEFVGGGDPMQVVVHPTADQPSFPDACAERIPEHRDFAGEPQRYPQQGRSWLRVAFIASALSLTIGLPVWLEARAEGDAYVARHARERDAVAVISQVWVEEGSDGEGNADHTTFVTAHLRLDTGRVYEIEVHRPGDLVSHYDEEDPLPVVYDSSHPSDADFADRPTRRAQHSSVALRKTTGPLFFFAGVIGVFGVGSVMVYDWRRRTRATRRTSPTLR